MSASLYAVNQTHNALYSSKNEPVIFNTKIQGCEDIKNKKNVQLFVKLNYSNLFFVIANTIIFSNNEFHFPMSFKIPQHRILP